MNRRVSDFRSFIRLRSLRHRYLGVAVFLSILVLMSAVFTERFVSSASQASASNIDARTQFQQKSRAVRNAVWGTEYALQSYILDPAPWYREAVTANIRNALDDTLTVGNADWIRDGQLTPIIAGIAQNLRELETQTQDLMDIRANVERLFPSAALMDNFLSPTNANFLTQVQLALEEISMEEDPARSTTYQAFEDVRHAWSQMISAFRLYIVRRAGIYSDTDDGLDNANHDVALLYELTQQHIQVLEALDEGGKLGFQASDSLQQLKQQAQTWIKAFDEFRLLQETAHWRSDIPVIQNAVQPLFGSIWNQLDLIDKHIEASAEKDVSAWAEVGRQLNRNILSLSALALLFIGLGFIYFQRTVLDPFSQLTRAMKDVAQHDEQISLPPPGSIEAQDLIDAFVLMRRKVHERQIALRHQTLHDALTGLPNRVLLKDRLQQSILSSEREQDSGFCLLMIDLDRFKEINDTLGHQAGDQVLCEIGRRLPALLRRSDTVARLGGDEFAVLLPESSIRHAQEVSAMIAESIEQPIVYQERELILGASIGIAAFPDHGRDVDTLMKRADVAMYVAKQNSLEYSVYNAQQDRNSVGKLALISELRAAIAANELKLHYQPKVDLMTGAVVGVEALLRWPQWSSVQTEYLIKTAEKSGLIKPLTQWVLQQTLRQMADWYSRGVKLRVAVNLSTWNLSHSDIDETVAVLLRQFGIPANQLELEITENALLKNPDRAGAILERLHDLGVHLTIDDYGTGVSSLAHLKTLPVDQIKIDRSFVSDMLDDDNDAVIVRSTIDLAHNLGMKVIAEGVSNAEIWDLLEILRCDIAQGYFIAHPMPADALEAWLMKGHSRRGQQSRLA